MIFEKTVKAKVISLNIEDIESIDVHNDLTSAMAAVEKSKSMYWHVKRYHVVFCTEENTTKEFVIDRKLYDELAEGRNGVLTYYGNKMVSFVA